MSRPPTLVLVLTGCLAACASSGPTAADIADIEPSEVAEVLGGDCDPDVDYGDALVDVARTEEWLEVVGIDPSVDLGEYSQDGGTTEDLDVTARPVASFDDVGSETDRTLTLHTAFVPGIAWGLEHDARVFAGVNDEGFASPRVTFVMVEDTEGGWVFPVICPTGGLGRLASEDPDRLRQVIGMTDPVAAEAILRDPTPSTSTPASG